LLRYDGPVYLLTLAPTRAGKGVGTVIPKLLAAERSVLVIDPRGENAKIAGELRRRFGDVHRACPDAKFVRKPLVSGVFRQEALPPLPF